MNITNTEFLLKNIEFNKKRSFVQRLLLELPIWSILKIMLILLLFFVLDLRPFWHITIIAVCYLLFILISLFIVIKTILSTIRDSKFWISRFYKSSDGNFYIEIYRYDKVCVSGIFSQNLLTLEFKKLGSISSVICLFVKIKGIIEFKQPPILEWANEIKRLYALLKMECKPSSVKVLPP